MHGMICKSLEAYLATTHGASLWAELRLGAGLPEAGFEPLETYEDATFAALLAAAAGRLGCREADLLEDVGAWICVHPPLESVRRLLRFCGTTFRALLLSLEEVEARARMSLPDLDLPSIRLEESGDPGHFVIRCGWSAPGAGDLVAGVLRAMASDHGALAVIEAGPPEPAGAAWTQEVRVALAHDAFHAPRAFALSAGGA